jgi:beta-xylosidase
MSWFRKTKVTVSVTEGQIPVNSVIKIVDHKDVKVYHLDSSAKYYEPTFYSYIEDDNNQLLTVSLGFNERTRNHNPDKPVTDITFTIPKKSKNKNDYWYMESWSSRYTTVIVLYGFFKTSKTEFLKDSPEYII